MAIKTIKINVLVTTNLENDILISYNIGALLQSGGFV
jgi:hypothetical protein